MQDDVTAAREMLIRHLRENFGDEAADDREAGIDWGREDGEDFIVGYLLAIRQTREQCAKVAEEEAARCLNAVGHRAGWSIPQRDRARDAALHITDAIRAMGK